MLIKNLPFEAIPHVKFSDPAYRVLTLMQDYNVRQMPVTNQGKFAGLVSEDLLLEVDGDCTIGELQHLLQPVFVNEDDHFLKAVALATANNLNLIAVTDAEAVLTGCIKSDQLLKHLAGFMNVQEQGAMIVLEVNPQQYSFSEMSKIIELNDAHITQLNTSSIPDSTSMLVTIKINKLEISDIVSSFQRYEYNVKYYSGEELYANELKDNYENLMNYLNI
ncbi:MAG: CBS domain-containing protein [Niabella sp.]